MSAGSMEPLLSQSRKTGLFMIAPPLVLKVMFYKRFFSAILNKLDLHGVNLDINHSIVFESIFETYPALG